MFLRLSKPSALEQIEAVKATIDSKGRSHQISGFALRAPLRLGQYTRLARAIDPWPKIFARLWGLPSSAARQDRNRNSDIKAGGAESAYMN